MGKVDIATKQYMSHRDVIADVFNFYIYDGRQVGFRKAVRCIRFSFPSARIS